MKRVSMQFLISIFVMFFSSYSLGSGSVSFDIKKKLIPIKHATLSYETDAISLNRGLDGRVQSIEAKRCASCELERHQVNSSTQAFIGAQEVDLDSVSEFNGKSGTVIYDPETNELSTVLFFNLEEDK